MKLNNFLRYGIFTGLALIPFTPLVVTSSMFFPFITGKNFMFRILVVAITALWLVLMARDSSARPKSSLILWGALALLVITSLSTIFGLNPYRSFWSNYERMDGLITQIHLFLYFIVATGVLTTRRYWYNFFNVNLLAASCVSLYALSQLMGASDIHQGGTRIDATLGNAAYMAVYMLINLFLAAYLAVVTSKGSWLKFVYGTLVVWFTVLLYLTQTRGTILGLIGGLFLFGLILAWRSEGRLRKIALGLSIGVIVIVGMFFALKDTSFVRNNQTLNRFASISLTEQTTTSRFTIWKMSLKGVAERPILGWGPEGYVYVFSKYYDPVLWKQEPWFDRSHNVFLDWLVTTGILGLTAYLFLFGAAIYYLFVSGLQKKKDATPAINQSEMIGAGLLIALLVAYLCHNFFVFDNLISYILFFSLLGFVHTIATEQKRNLFSSIVVPEWGIYTVTTVAIVLSIGTLYFANIKPIMVSRSLIRAMSSGNSETKLSEFQKIFTLNTFGSKEATEQYLTSGVMSILSDSNASVAVRQSSGELALQQINQQIKEVGPDARPYIIFGSFMANIGRFEDALNYLKQAAVYSPKKQVVYMQAATYYVSQKDFSQALAAAKKAYELDPTYPEANLMYALVAAYSGNLDLADQILVKWHEAPSVINDERLINVYNSLGLKNKVAEVLGWRINYYEKLIMDDPTGENNYVSLADTWLKLNNKQKENEILTSLIKVLKEKIKENPDSADLYIRLAETYFRLGDNENVSSTINLIVGRLEDKIKNNPRDTNSYTAIAEIYSKAGRSDLAKQVLEKAAAVNPGFRYKAAELISKLPAPAAK